MLSARFAGVTVTWPNGLAGSGARVGIRGINSFFSSGTPLLVIDGIDASGEDYVSPFVGVRAVPSRLDDLDPFFIERIEVLRGPVAAAMYGSGAAAGVLRVTTRRGAPGPARWRAFAEGSATPFDVAFPDNFAAPGRVTGSGSPVPNCPLGEVASGRCVQDSIIRWNPLARASPFRTGFAQRAGVSGGGGLGRTTYFAGVTGDNQSGPYRENDNRRLRLDTRVSHTFGQGFELGIQGAYLRGRLRVPPTGIVPYGMRGAARRDSLAGDLIQTPDQMYAGSDWSERTTRSLLGAHARWRARRWLEVSALAGFDRTTVDERILRTYSYPGTPQGDLRNERLIDAGDRRGTLRASADLRHRLLGLDGRATLSLDERRERWRQLDREQYVDNGDTVASRAVQWDVPFTIRGLSLSEQLVRRELALNLGVRLERAGEDKGRTKTRTFPSAELVWTAQRARLARYGSFLSALRLSGGFGEAGDYRSELRILPSLLLAGPMAGPFVPLGTERTRDVEVGAAFAVLDDRVRFTAGRYSRRTRDALLFGRGYTPWGFLPRLIRGDVSNVGLEATLDGTVATFGRARWSAALSAATNRNRIESLEAPPTMLLGPAGPVQAFAVGYPVGGFWGQPLTYSDANGDGLIARSEVQYSLAEDYRGAPMPTRMLALRNEITIGPRYVIRVRVEHLGGHKRFNASARTRCFYAVCPDAIDRRTPLERQAQVYSPDGAPYLEDASFTKLREVSLSVKAPRPWANLLAGDRLTFTVSGRDLLTWSSYRGLDPETNTARTFPYASADQGEIPRLPTYNARIDVAW